MRLARRVLGVFVFVAVLVVGWRFAADHSAKVTITTPVSEGTQVTLWVALLVSFALGACVAGAVGAYQAARLALVARRYRKTIRELEVELHQLRNLPLGKDQPPLADSASEAATVSASRGVLGRGT